MKILLFFAFYWSTAAVYAQQNPLSDTLFNFKMNSNLRKSVPFVPDTAPSRINAKYNDIIDSTFKIAKDYTFELRLWKRYLSHNFDNVFILTLKNNKWEARYFDQAKGNFQEQQVDQRKVEQLWVVLNNHQIRTLPRYDAIRNQLAEFKLDTITFNGTRTISSMLDGVLYSFELRNSVGTKTYDYSNPKFYFDKYRNVEALFEVVNLVMIIQRFLGQPLSVG